MKFIPNQIGYGTKVEEFHSSTLDFSDAELEKIQEAGKLIYQCSGYDEDGYYQTGFIEGTLEDIGKCDIEYAYVLRNKDCYERYFGADFIAKICH